MWSHNRVMWSHDRVMWSHERVRMILYMSYSSVHRLKKLKGGVTMPPCVARPRLPSFSLLLASSPQSQFGSFGLCSLLFSNRSRDNRETLILRELNNCTCMCVV